MRPVQNILWTYKGLNAQGHRIQGTIQSPSINDVHASLEARHLLVTNLQPASAMTRFMTRHQRSITQRDLLGLFQQALYLCQSGMSIPQWLQSLADNHHHHALYDPLCAMRHRVLQGHPLSHSLNDLGNALDDVVKGFVLQGEQTGQIHVALKAIVDYLTWHIHLRHTWWSKARYPLVLCVAITIMLMVFSLVLVPEWEKLFQTLQIPMGLWTRSVLSTLKLFPDVMCGVGILGLGLTFYSVITRQSPLGVLCRTLPMIQDLCERRALYDWLHTMSISLRSHLSLLDSVALCAHSASHMFKATSEDIHRTLKQGFSLSEALSRISYAPQSMRSLIHAAEQSNNLIACFEMLTHMHAQDLEQTIQKRIQMLEPCVLTVLGLVIGTLIVGLLYPLYQNTGNGGF